MANPPFQVKATFDYKSPHEDDLSFPNAQIITVTDEEDNDWYYGEYVDAAGKKQEGLFPRNFVKPYEPETPPRPSRSNRAKKEPEPTNIATETKQPDEDQEAPLAGASSRAVPPTELKEPEAAEDMEPEPQPEAAAIAPAPPTLTKASPPAVPPASREPKPTPPIGGKGPPPAVTEKPVSGSFRDRINAFNKSSAPPPAPSKPAGLGGSAGSSFIKKPFVAPPPSKNAFVPPPRQDAPHKIYRREEDPELLAKSSREQEDEEPTPQAQASQADESEDQPKPTSLKERIALLQKQQADQAARHAEKKDKPKRPPKKQELEEPPPDHDDDEGEDLEKLSRTDTAGKKSIDASRDARTIAKPRKSREEAADGSSVAVPPRDTFSDGNDADQSGAADTGEEEDQSTGRDDSDEKPKRQTSIANQQLPQPPIRQPKNEEAEGEEDGGEEDEEEEEDDVDPEVKRRMEIRERMAKMSGGMGMAGMFGPPGGVPQPRAPTRQGTGSSDRKLSGSSKNETAAEASRAPPVPLMPMPGLTKVRSPEAEQTEVEVEKDDGPEPRSFLQDRDPEDVPDIEDVEEEPPAPSRKSTERGAPPPPPPSQGQTRGVPPPVPTERPAPPPPSSSRPLPPPPSQPLSQSEGSLSDDEMPPQPKGAGLDETIAGGGSNSAARGPPPPPPSGGPPPPMPSRPSAPQTRLSEYGNEGLGISNPTTPVSPSEKRSSRVPPIPGAVAAPQNAPQSRAPPPPPPSAAPSIPAPPSRSGTLNVPGALPTTSSRGAEVSDEEVTEYDGDYDTDMASGATHKDALSAHGRNPSGDDESESMTESEAAMHHGGLPSMGPAVTAAPRAVPPPPPAPTTRPTRQSSDMPRAAPPPAPRRNESYDDPDYDPFNYNGSLPPRSATGRNQSSTTPTVEEPEELFDASPPQRSVPPPQQPLDQYPVSPNMAMPGRSARGQSSDIQRTSTSIRRSTDAPRQSVEHGNMAADVDLAAGSRWWTIPNAPPPIFQNRRDILFETEDASIAKRGGKQAITRTVYILFMDYSQSTITAQYESHSPANASLEQSHEPPPRSLRQDQLEDAHSKFGAQIAKAVELKKESVVRDGTPHALPLDLISSIPDALLPVGIRAYGALVYANLANASVQQYDEIRSGDIVTFRNAKFQGHRGTMHSKYSIDVGKPDHVAVVLDWDGTKKKVRAWEQGRESKKVKPESFKFGDMKSGEVKVWRVMARSWVGWEGQN